MTEAYFDNLLTRALIASIEREWIMRPDNGELDALFPDTRRLDRRMSGLFKNPERYIKRFRKPWYVRVLRFAAIVALAIGVLFGALMLNPQARAWIAGIVASWFEDHNEYSYFGDETEEFHRDWMIGYVPEDYELIFEELNESYCKFIFTCSGNKQIIVDMIGTNTRTSLDNERYTIIKATVHGIEANLYLPADPAFPYMLVWYWPEYGAWVNVACDAGEEELFKVAEGITPQEAK